jgi:PAS domain S-box-containing protein
MGPTSTRSTQYVLDPDSTIHMVIFACLAAVGCYELDRLAYVLGIPPDNIASFWPATSFLVAMFLLVPRRNWPLLTAAGLGGMALADFLNGVSIGFEIWITLGNLAEVLVATLGMRLLFNGTPQLNSVKALAKYLVFAVLFVPFASAFLGANGSMMGYWVQWRLWFFADALAFLTVGPAILSWVPEARAWARNPLNYLELAALMASLVIFGYLAFMGTAGTERPALLYCLVPLLLWAALRLGLKGVSTSMIVVALQAIWGVAHGRGPFAGQGPLNSALSLQLFLFFAAIPFTILAVLVEERKRAQQALADEGEQLIEAQRLAQVGSWQWDPGTDTAAWSEELYRIAGRDPNLPPPGYKEFPKLYTPESLERLTGAVEKALRTGKGYELDLETIRPDGSTRWIIARGEVQRDAAGRIVALRGTAKDITERKRTEEALRESDERFRMAAHAGRMFAYEWNPATDEIVRSEGVFQVLGENEGTHTTGQKIMAMAPPEDRERLVAAIAALSPDKPCLRISYRMVRSDGIMIWVERNSLAHFDEQGRLLRTVGMVADVTERKRAEEAVRESEQRFKLVANTAPVMIWVSGPDKLCTYFNLPWLEFTGRPLEDELGNGWAEAVHPEDLTRCLDTYRQSFDRRKPFKMEYRLRRHDGEYRWVLDIGVPRLNGDGSFAGYIGSAADITERKEAEEALSTVSGRMIRAQEEERRRIARELHDDINQRLALLAVELRNFGDLLPDSLSTLRNYTQQLFERTSGISEDVQALSHELHSSRLEYLGLVAAMRSFCTEFGAQQKAEIDFAHSNVPSPLPRDISLCLFRILQEALRNGVRHSGAQHFEVNVQGSPAEIHLTVRDSGAGFDPKLAENTQGLGLISMQERVRLVKGTFSITSRPQSGTEISVRVPLSVGTRTEQAKLAGA